MIKASKRKKPIKYGFTIVELLIVIVIIGILAAIVIVAYRGIQQRANNSQTISVVNSHVKANKQYAADNGKYPEPSPGGVAWSCMGTDYPGNTCFNGDASLACSGLGPLPSGSWYNDAVKAYMQNKSPTANFQAATCGSSAPFTGAAALSNWPTSGSIGIFYIIAGGGSNCGSPGGYASTLWLSFDNNYVSCYIILPNP